MCFVVVLAKQSLLLIFVPQIVTTIVKTPVMNGNGEGIEKIILCSLFLSKSDKSSMNPCFKYNKVELHTQNTTKQNDCFQN